MESRSRAAATGFPLQDQLFLMNAHPDSLDGRYFRATDRSDIEAIASLILHWR